MRSRFTFRSGEIRFVRFALTALVAAGVVAGCSSGGSDGDGDPQPDDGVTTLASRQAVLVVTTEGDVAYGPLLSALDNRVLFVDEVSGSVLRVAFNGALEEFVSGDDLEALVGDPVELGPLDQIPDGTQESQFIASDVASGLLLRFQTDGTPVVHATPAQISAGSGGVDPRIHLPRYLTTNQLIAQDLETGNVLRIGSTGQTLLLVPRLTLAAVAGVPPSVAVVEDWVRGGRTGFFYARFPATNNIVRIDQTGTDVRRWVDGAIFDALFPDIDAPVIIDFVADPATDAILILLGTGPRGLVVALLPDGSQTPAILADEADFVATLAGGYDLSDLGVLLDGTPFAIDEAGVNVLTFNSEGRPLVVARKEGIERESGSTAPGIPVGVGIGDGGVVLPERTSDRLLLVQ